MAKIKLNLESYILQMYAKAGHPLGKTRKGRKKWLKRKIMTALIKWASYEK